MVLLALALVSGTRMSHEMLTLRPPLVSFSTAVLGPVFYHRVRLKDFK